MDIPKTVSQIRHRYYQPTVFRLYRFAWSGLDWLYPPQCGGCGQEGMRWCPECEQKTRKLVPPVCNICGEQLAREGLCRRCQEGPPRFDALRSWAVFAGPLRQALHRLKYQQDVSLGEALAEGLIEVLRGQDWQADMVIPVPVSRGRQAERGYNQASLLALPVALCFGIDYLPGGLVKSRETRSQVGLDAGQRRENVANAFRAEPRFVRGKTALVIDDLTTTGSTLDDCAWALLEVGATKVYALTLARAENPSADSTTGISPAGG